MLELASAKRDNAQYKKCANLLEAVHQLMEHFQQYEAVPKVGAHSALQPCSPHKCISSTMGLG